MNHDHLLEMRDITKDFPGVRALDHVDLRVRRGEIHAIVGENGAGKSTLMNVLSGVHPHGSYDGSIYWEGDDYRVRTIRQSEERGIAIIHQEFALTPYLSIAENIFLGNEKARNGVIDRHATRKAAEELCATVGLDEDVGTPVMSIGVGKKQLVEIAKALSKNIRLLILDEPTAALNEIESKALLQLLLRLKNEGMTSVLISHKLNEVLNVADTITILRDGKTVETLSTASDDLSEARIIKGMVGRDLVGRFPERRSRIGEVVFEVRGWNVYHPLINDRRVIRDVHIRIRKGEVVGIAGLMGAGRTEFAMSVFGRSYGRDISGEVRLHGTRIDTRTVKRAIENGIAYISEDRKALGLILTESVKDNITLANLEGVSRRGVIRENSEIRVAERAVETFAIKCPTIKQHVRNLSGGNQQKVVLAKWFFCDSDVYILDEPTRGIDVGAKYDVYTVINDLAERGKSILFISSELPEILGVCDRIYVMNSGTIVGEFDRDEATQEAMLRLMI